MNDFIFISFTILVTTGLIYFLYTIMLGSEKSDKDVELQITSEDILKQLTILHKQKKYNIVESLAKNYLSKKGGDDGVRTILTKALHSAGRLYEAMEQAKIVISHNPLNLDMHIFLANCYLEVDKPMRAIEIFQDVLDKDSNHVVAIKELAQVYFKTNQKKSSMEMYKRLDEFLDSNYEKAKNRAKIAEIHFEYREIDLAIKEYMNVLEIYPDDMSVKRRLIELYKILPDYDSLIELANEIYAEQSENENGLWCLDTLMNIYQLTQNYEKALEYANLIKTHPLARQNEIDEDIAKILFGEGKIDEGIELLKSLVAQDPNNISLKKELANAYIAKQDFDVATYIYKEILDIGNAGDVKQIHFELSDLYSNWAAYLFSQNEIDECFKKFAVALKYHDQNPDTYYRLGIINKEIKNFNESIKQFKKAIELDPNNSAYYDSIAECYQEIDSIYEQKKALIDSLKCNPENAKSQYKLGVIYDIQNDQNNALLHIKTAVKLDENFIDAKKKLALILEHTGNQEEAIALYENILRLDPENEDVLNNLKMLKG